MNILVIGSGGREHAIIKKIKDDNPEHEIYCAPGNGGISYMAKCVNISATQIDEIVQFSKQKNIDYVVVAPDDPLVLGAVDALEKEGIRAFGPSKAAAQIEGSKVFSKNLMKKYKIPTADYFVFEQAQKALDFVENYESYPLVIKADGLALGKGVIICANKTEAAQTVKEIMQEGKFGAAGNKVVMEEFLMGPEVSVLCFADGENILPMHSSMDHKRIGEGNTGLNTGGMGTIAPNPFYTKEIEKTCMNTIFMPTIKAMKAEGCPFKGCLYFGLMLTENGPKVIEYNCRFGDPEAQVVLPLLRSNLLRLMQACTDGVLKNIKIDLRDQHAACVILASEGYPEAYKTGKSITGLAGGQILNSTATVYHAGTAYRNGELQTNGGRVLGVCALGDDLKTAVKNAYTAQEKVMFGGKYLRFDIGTIRNF